MSTSQKSHPRVSNALTDACKAISETKNYRGMGIPSIAKECNLGQDRLYKLVSGKAGKRGIPFEVYYKMSKRFPFVESILNNEVAP